MLICPVRDCRLPLTREGRRIGCPRGHSFDVARSGYINLLQPQDRRSKEPGDAAAVVAARRRLHDLGLSAPFLEAIAGMTAASSGDTVLDAGCGDGFYAGSLAGETGCGVTGVDISVPAVDAAARRYPDCQWIVTNADRLMPFADESFSRVLSITGRMNASETRRVLRSEGRLVVAVPAPDDLVELRGPGPDRVARTMETFAQGFIPEKQRRITVAVDLNEQGVRDVRVSTYRPAQAKPIEAMRVTFSLDVLLFGAR